MVASRRPLIIVIVAALILAGVIFVGSSSAKGLPIYNPGYHELPPASDPLYKDQGVVKSGPDIVCGDTDLTKPAEEPICPEPGSPKPDESSDTTSGG